MLQYRFSTDAIADLESISDYLRDRNPDAADQVVSSIFAAIKRAYIFPASNPTVEDFFGVPGTRKLIEQPGWNNNRLHQRQLRPALDHAE